MALRAAILGVGLVVVGMIFIQGCALGGNEVEEDEFEADVEEPTKEPPTDELVEDPKETPTDKPLDDPKETLLVRPTEDPHQETREDEPIEDPEETLQDELLEVLDNRTETPVSDHIDCGAGQTVTLALDTVFEPNPEFNCGRFCGKNWCDGMYIEEVTCAFSKQPAVEGGADSCCRRHDECCGRGGHGSHGTCNADMIACLQNVSNLTDGCGKCDRIRMILAFQWVQGLQVVSGTNDCGFTPSDLETTRSEWRDWWRGNQSE
jgi:hypothetical protein